MVALGCVVGFPGGGWSFLVRHVNWRFAMRPGSWVSRSGAAEAEILRYRADLFDSILGRVDGTFRATPRRPAAFRIEENLCGAEYCFN